MCSVAGDSEAEHKCSVRRQGGRGSFLGGKGGIAFFFFFVRPVVTKLLLSVTHFYAWGWPPGEKAAIK